MSEWTPEPWPAWRDKPVTPYVDSVRAESDYMRACECVNALAGIPDPAAALKAAREALTLAHNAAISHENSPMRQKIRNALALLEGKNTPTTSAGDNKEGKRE